MNILDYQLPPGAHIKFKPSIVDWLKHIAPSYDFDMDDKYLILLNNGTWQDTNPIEAKIIYRDYGGRILVCFNSIDDRANGTVDITARSIQENPDFFDHIKLIT